MHDDLTDLYQEVILDHSRTPRNFFKLETANRLAQGQNPLCGDDYTVYLRIEDDRVQEVSFQGSGCAISKASASIMTSAIQGKTRTEVKELFEKVHQMVTGGEASDIGKLAVFAGVHKFPARVKCAILPWHAALAAVQGDGGKVSTE